MKIGNQIGLFFILLMTFLLPSCTKSDPVPDAARKSNDIIVGRWALLQETYEAIPFGLSFSKYFAVDDLQNAILQFKNDYTGFWHYKTGESTSFTYTISGNTLLLNKIPLIIKSSNATSMTLCRSTWGMNDTLFIGGTAVGVIKNYELVFEREIE